MVGVTMGRRERRRRAKGGSAASAALSTTDYRDDEGNVLTLRDELSASTVAKLRGDLDTRTGASFEDVEARRTELLFERLALRWEIAGLPLEDQGELLGRFRMADPELRRWVTQTMREHGRTRLPELGL